MTDLVLKRVPYSDIALEHGKVADIDSNVATGHYANDDLIVACVLDTETATRNVDKPFDFEESKVIELSMIKVLVSRNDGCIVKIVSALNQLNDPGFSILPETTAVTGLTDADVSGKSLCDKATAAFIEDVDIVLAHNARFDRGMLQGITNVFDAKVWGCTSKGDIDWKVYGLSCSKLECAVMRTGGYYTSHRATPDVFALIFLLSRHPNALYSIIRSANTNSYEVRAVRAPKAIKDELKLTHNFTALYENGQFQYWHKSDMDFDTAQTNLTVLKSLYAANDAECLILVPASEKYKRSK